MVAGIEKGRFLGRPSILIIGLGALMPCKAFALSKFEASPLERFVEYTVELDNLPCQGEPILRFATMFDHLVQSADALAIIRQIANRQHYSRQALNNLVQTGRINPTRVGARFNLYDPLEIAAVARSLRKGGAA